MPKKMQILLFLLLIPLLGFSTALYVEYRVDTQLQGAVITEIPDADPALVPFITLRRICTWLPEEGGDLCTLAARLGWLRNGSLFTAAIGLIWLLVIWLAGKIAAGKRSLLVSVFTPLIYVTLVLVIGLTAAQAVIAIGAIYIGGSALFGIIHIGIIASIGVGVFFGVRAIATSLWAAVKRAQAVVIGKPLSEVEAPELWRQVRSAAEQLGASMPDHVVVGLDPTFFVTEVNVKTV